ncbi:MAG: hypothetical protein VB144_13810 [Clostridia bacterium]|nr:hypothetical protein [Clostridia bacterium]
MPRKNLLQLVLTLIVLAISVSVVPAMAAEPAKVSPWEYSTPGVDRMPFVYGNTLYYVRDYDIYYSIWDDAARAWSEPKAIPGAVNTGANEIWPCLTSGGKVLYFARYDPISDYDFYRSEWDEANAKWGEPVLIEELSTDTQEWAIWVNEDETIAYVTTKGVYGDGKSLGGRDIWKSARGADGVWGVPMNVGEPINTTGNEWSVFVGADGRMYIDGTREETLGLSDIYVAENDKAQPANIGAPINSAVDEREVCVTDKFIVFSANKRQGGAGGYDLWYIVLEPGK